MRALWSYIISPLNHQHVQHQYKQSALMQQNAYCSESSNSLIFQSMLLPIELVHDTGLYTGILSVDACVYVCKNM
jgi:hypothetical protein